MVADQGLGVYDEAFQAANDQEGGSDPHPQSRSSPESSR